MSSPARHPATANLRGVLDQVKLVATGGMSLIFRARQPSLERYIVVKQLKTELRERPETVERFRREAKALAQVLHQNIAHVYDFVETKDDSYILMEHIDGVDLSVAIEKVGHLPPDIAVAILLAVARGVAYIHEHNLIHRDIKPSNIRLTTRGEVKLMDFGIVMDISDESLTKPGLLVGSPSYLSPEQVLGDAITPHTDVFLLGICFYEMLTGTRPFREENGQTVYQRIREAVFVKPSRVRGHVPAGLDAVVAKCLRKEPARRYKSAASLVTALEKYLGPERSAHVSDVVLKFLDDEALVAPAVPVREIRAARKGIRALLSWQTVIGAAAGVLLAFGAGYWVGVAANSVVATPPSYKPPVPVGKAR